MRCRFALSGLARVHDQTAKRVAPQKLLGTMTMAGLCILVFVGQTIGGLTRGSAPSILSMDKAEQVEAIRFGATYVVPALIVKEPWRLLSAAFVHFGILHIFMNLLGLRYLSRVAEPAVGPARYVIAYVCSAIVSFATTAVVVGVTGRPTFTAGASGAIFGVMGLILGFLLRRKDPRWKAFAMQTVVFAVVFGYAVNASGSGVMVNNSAHLGGLVCGFIFGWFYGHRPAVLAPRPSRERWVNGLAILMLAGCIGSLVMAQLSPLWREFERIWLG